MNYIIKKIWRCHVTAKIAGPLVFMWLLLQAITTPAQDCVEKYFLSVETIKSGEQVTYTASGTIFCSEGKPFIVEKGGYATLKAGGRIELNAGFQVLTGGGLTALLEKCDTGDAGESELKVFPNPTDGELHVESPYKIGTVRLLDMDGVIVMEQKDIQSTSVVMDISKAKPGLYILEVTTDKGIEKEKVEKK
jgi:hypothetical protein